MMALGADEVIVVDYDCPNGSGDWARSAYPDVKVVDVRDDSEFCAARGRNLGAERASSDWLLFIDADIVCAPEWMDWMQQHLRPRAFFRASRVNGIVHPETAGTAICPPVEFKAVGGYDEIFRGAWGGEDIELYRRLQVAGLASETYPHEFLSPILHGDEERAGWAGVGSKAQRAVVTACYTDAKRQLARFLGPKADVPMEIRRALMDHPQNKLQRWFADGARGHLDIRYSLNSKQPFSPSPYMREGVLQYVIRVREADAAEAARSPYVYSLEAPR